MKKFFSQLGCFLWLVAYVVVGILAGRWAFFIIPTAAPLVIKIVAGVLVGIIVFLFLCVITFLIMIAVDKDWDSPGPLPTKPLNPQEGP